MFLWFWEGFRGVIAVFVCGVTAASVVVARFYRSLMGRFKDGFPVALHLLCLQ